MAMVPEEEEGTLSVPRVAVWAVYLTVFLDMLGSYISNPVIPFYAQLFGASSHMVGYLFSAPALAAVVTSRMLGRAADIYGRRPLFIASLLGAALGSILQVCATSFATLMAARFFFGIWMNSMLTAQMYLADVSTGLVRSACMAQLTSIKQLAMLFGPGVGGVLSQYGLNVPILADGVATLIAAAFCYAFLAESPVWQQEKEKVSAECSQVQSRPSRRFMTLMIPTCLNAAVLVNTNMTLAVYAQKKHGFNAFHVGLMYLFACAITVVTTSCCVTRIQRMIGLFTMAVTTCAGQGICLMLMAFTDEDWAFVFWYFISRIFASAKLASAQTVLSNLTEPANRGRLMGIKSQVENVATIIAPPIMGWLLDLDLTYPWIFCALAQVVGAACTWAVRPPLHETKPDGYVALAREPDFTPSVTPTSTAPSTPTTLAVKIESKKKIKVAIMKYQFGSYDYKGVNDKWQIPKFDDYEVRGFFYASKGVLSDQDVLDMKAYGWKAIIVDLEPGTPYVADARVTTKKHKFCVPMEVRAFDFVITHDCDVDADYRVGVPYLIELMEERGNAALFQQHERGFSTLEEIDLFLTEKCHRILTSREMVIEWRAEVVELVKSGQFDLSGPAYIKGNLFAFRPDDAAFLKCGQRIFEKCLVIQRDQFIMPWAVQAEKVNYSLVSQPDLEKYGAFSFPVLLRDARTGVFN